jgi:threonine/homoserine/homoserine lactone efflux protein
LFGSLLENLTIYKLQIGTVGGIFLVSLGLFYLFFKKYHTKEELDKGVKIDASTHAKLFITGFLINTLNPGVIALWLAAATKSISNTLEEKIVTFSICLAMNIAADFFKINLAGKLRSKLNDKNIVIINKISGSMFLAFGIALIVGVWFNKFHT